MGMQCLWIIGKLRVVEIVLAYSLRPPSMLADRGQAQT
jgi:hypothetical protein